MERYTPAAEAAIKQAAQAGAEGAVLAAATSPEATPADEEVTAAEFLLGDLDLPSAESRVRAEAAAAAYLAKHQYETMTLEAQIQFLQSRLEQLNVLWKLGSVEMNHYRFIAEEFARLLNDQEALVRYLADNSTPVSVR